MEFLTFTLPSGIRCIHKRVKSAVTHCALTINTGSRDELSDEHGIAHFVEHGLFKGTGRRRAFHINSRLENLGGELNAFTTKEDTTVNASTLKGDFPKAAELIADMVFGSTFPEHEIERERQVIVDEINSYRDIQQEMLYDSFDELMFAGSPLGRPIAGTARSVAKFDSAKLKSFVSRTYTPDQMVFSAIGNVSEKTFRAVCERCFGTIPAIPAVTAIPAIPAVTAGPVIPVIASIPATSVAEASRVAPVHLSIASISETSTAQTAPAPPASPAPPATSAASAAPIPPAPPAPPPTRREFERTPPPELVPFEKEVSKRANHQSHCVLGNRAYSLHDDRRLPLSLLVNVLGGPAANSRLNSVLRERNGLTYNIEANYVP
ncbi:MAG: insulinase family protein, partial [Alistipes sp.]|nr:insulinase family protein [Alistipes sp.]